jgi:hypothetical protein
MLKFKLFERIMAIPVQSPEGGNMKKKIFSITMIFALGFLSIDVVTAQGVKQKYQADSERGNEVILAASSPFEDMTEAALAGDKKGIERALRAYDAQAGKVEGVLPAAKRDELRVLIADIRKAKNQGSLAMIVLKAPEAYRTLIEGLDRGSLKVPMEVSLLDYAGFRFLALLHVQPVDWRSLQGAAEQARKNWISIKTKVTDGGLRDAVDVAVEGMNRACILKNADMALLAAQVDLALVDLLETGFETVH